MAFNNYDQKETIYVELTCENCGKKTGGDVEVGVEFEEPKFSNIGVV